MKKESWFFEEEIDLKSGYCIDCQAEAEIYYSIDNNYGADIDGNRGVKSVCIEDIDILTDTIRLKFNDKLINFKKLKLNRRAEILEKIRAGIEKKL